MDVISREESGLIEPDFRVRMSASLGIYGHWSAGPPDQTPREIQRYHMEGRGWSDIAYSFLVDQEGNIYEGRGWGIVGGHTLGYNSTAHAVCAIAGLEGQVTRPMLAAMAEVFNEHDRLYGEGYHRPHREVSATACPGETITQFIHSGNFTEPGVLDMDAIEQIAAFEHDTRRLILAGQIRDLKEHRKTRVAVWRTRSAILHELNGKEDEIKPQDIEEAETAIHKLEKQIAEMDGDPFKPTVFDDIEPEAKPDPKPAPKPPAKDAKGTNK